MVEMRNSYRILAGLSEWNSLLGRPRRRWEDNIKMERGVIMFADMDWIHLDWDRGRWRALVNTVMNFGFHKRQGIS
jgi:hypothetical protein